MRTIPILGVVDNLGVTGAGARRRSRSTSASSPRRFSSWPRTPESSVPRASRTRWRRTGRCPEVFRRLHPRFKTPWLSLVVFAGVAPILVILPGDTTFVGTLYSFGATLSFTVAHASIVRLRMKPAEEEEPVPGAPESPVGRSRLAAVRGARRDRHRDLVPRHPRPERGDAVGGARLDGGRAHRLRRLSPPRRAERRWPRPVKAPPAIGPAMALEYRTIVVPIVAGEQAREAMHLAARLAAERRSTIVALRVIVVPLELPINADLPRTGGARRRAARRGARHRRPLRRAGRRARRSAVATPAPRSSPRRNGGTRRSSSWARRGCRTARARARSSARRPTTCCATPPLPRDDRRRQESCLMPAARRARLRGDARSPSASRCSCRPARAGGGIGYLLGVLFVGLGAGRLYLLRSRRGRG